VRNDTLVFIIALFLFWYVGDALTTGIGLSMGHLEANQLVKRDFGSWMIARLGIFYGLFFCAMLLEAEVKTFFEDRIRQFFLSLVLLVMSYPIFYNILMIVWSS
jgi:hypothetical protein